MDGTLFSINMSLLRGYSGIRYVACGDRLPSPSSGMRLPASGLRQFRTIGCLSPPRKVASSPSHPLAKSPPRSMLFALCPLPSPMPPALRPSLTLRRTSMLLKAGLYALRAVLTLRCLYASLSLRFAVFTLRCLFRDSFSNFQILKFSPFALRPLPFAFPHALRSSLFALYSMPHAPCPMLSALRSLRLCDRADLLFYSTVDKILSIYFLKTYNILPVRCQCCRISIISCLLQ